MDLGAMTRRIALVSPEPTTGHRVIGPTKSEAGKRLVVLLAFLRTDLRRHLDWFAEKEPGARPGGR